MEYRKFDNTYVIRLDVGEEIIEQLTAVAEKEKIRLAQVSAIGAINDFTIGVYNVAEKKYYPESFTGPWEIVSLCGSITSMDEKPYLHLHLSAGTLQGKTAGGHLTRAVISATCEIFVNVLDGNVGRVKDEVTGLNIFKFE